MSRIIIITTAAAPAAEAAMPAAVTAVHMFRLQADLQVPVDLQAAVRLPDRILLIMPFSLWEIPMYGVETA